MSSTHPTIPRDSRVGHPGLFLRLLFLRSASGPVIMVVAGLAMIAAAIVVVVGENGNGVSLPVWNVAYVICRCLAGLIGVAMLVSSVTSRGSESTRKETLSTVVWGGIIIAAAVIGLKLVLAVTGFFGLCLVLGGVFLLAGDYVGRASPTR